MADVLKILLIVVGILLIYVSYWLVSVALFPRLVEKASEAYARPVKLTFYGLGTALVPVVAGLFLANLNNPLVKIIGITLLVVPGMLGLAGSAGLARRIGAGLPSPVDADQPWRRVLRGGVVLALTFLLPIVGWIIIPLWVLVSGLGAFICVVRARQEENRGTPRAPAADAFLGATTAAG